jgi:hypothetical protein
VKSGATGAVARLTLGLRNASILLAVAPLFALPATAATHVVRGSDSATMLIPAGVQVESYANSGYQLVVEDSVAQVEIDAAPLASRQRFDLSSLPAAGSAEARLARAVAAGAKTRFEAVSRILGWISANVRYELDRTLAQDPRAVLERRSAYCTGHARLAVALLDALAIPAREIAGYVVDDFSGGAAAGFHRWIEVFYDDRGWTFSDPLASHNFVAATYLRLASSMVESDLPGPALLLSRDNRIEEIDMQAPAPARLVLARANGKGRRAAALRVLVPGFPDAEAELIGPDSRRSQSVRRGAAVFLGLAPATYEVRIRDRGRLEATRQITIDGPVLADVVIASATGFGGGAGGGGGRP